MNALSSVLLAAAFAFVVFPLLLSLERRGGGAGTVCVVFSLILLDAALYPDQSRIPGGLFHPGSGAFSFRPIDAVIPAALAARALARGFPQRLETAALWWLTFLFWLCVAAIEGLVNGNSSTLVAFEAKAILYLGAFLLTVGVPLGDYLRGRAFERFVLSWGTVAAVLVFTDQTNLLLSASLPVLPFSDTGEVGADAATLFATLGIVAATVGACRAERRLPLLLGATPLVITVAAATQRAALVGVVVALGVLALLLPLGGRRVRTTPTECALLALAMGGVLLVPFLVGAVVGLREPPVPFASTLSTTLGGQEKRLSAQARTAQLRVARNLVADRPLLGWGLGKTYTFYDPGPRQFATTNLTHNIAVDLLIRTGAFGLILFVGACVSSLLGGISAWRLLPDDAAAAFALAVVAAFAGLFAKGMVESLFEKYRLAALMGLLAGALVSAASLIRVTADEPERRVAAQPALGSRH